MKWHGLRFAANGQFHLVITWQRQWALRSSAGIESARDLNRIVVTQVPCETVHSFVSWNCLYALYAIRPLRRLLVFFLFLAGKMPHDISRRIEDIECNFLFRRGLEIVIDDRARRRVITDWLPFVEFLRVMQTHCGLRLIENNLGCG